MPTGPSFGNSNSQRFFCPSSRKTFSETLGCRFSGKFKGVFSKANGNSHKKIRQEGRLRTDFFKWGDL